MSAVPCRNRPDKLSMYRKKAHEAVDKFVDILTPKLLREEPLILQEISDTIEEYKGEMVGVVLPEFIHALHLEKREQTACPCPTCGETVVKKRDTSRRIETGYGSSFIERLYFYCTHSRIGFSPVDEFLELSSRKKQFDLQKLALEFLAEMPFK